MKHRLVRGEDGVTLPEMLITITLLMVMLFALYSIFDMSLRITRFGNAKVEAMDSARSGLPKMEREIRAAYPFNRAIGNNAVLANYGPRQITFGNDLNGNRRILNASGVPDTGEQITYQLSGSGPPYTLLRNSEPAVEYVEDITLSYLTRGGVQAGTEGAVEVVRMQLKIRVPDGSPATQTLTTDVALRNRGN